LPAAPPSDARIEAVIWGMPAVNLDLMLQAMIGSANGKPNQIVYRPHAEILNGSWKFP